ncbi:MAG: hypothetical protein J6Z25_02390 [Opitutales bacterium]|nr:hypothetical protein [Opitutales bacterium]
MAVLSNQQSGFLYLLAILYMQQSKYNLALHLLRVLSIHHPMDAKIALALAFCLYRSKRFHKAQTVMLDLDLSQLPKEFRAVFFYINSKILWELGEKEPSRKMLHKYLQTRISA